MKAVKYLSIRQPWAAQIFVEGEDRKDVENRSWSTPFRGRVWIHAGASKTDLKAIEEDYKEWGVPFPKNLEFGKIIGSVDIVDCLPSEEVDTVWAAEDGFGFLLENPKLLKYPVPFKANVGIRTLPPEVLAELEKAS